ncbi:hypothetical protein PAXINDRAFT_15344 [Paxillus involutus ATCC 200175]|uniref:Uncharacterized protein n=1 Tax=Paxillus involutus ATCC 200175 TaxID=664439 RepID=A0A0C9TWR4_PAXIN|nr:hypothetical protein PAXINDRAFT_15344 [Paxillus involutus ATCC 200175]
MANHLDFSAGLHTRTSSNLRYCYTPLASWIADTPEESLLAATSPKASPVTTATSKNFAYALNDALNYKNFLKAIKPLGLNGVVEPFWKDWPLSNPSDFLTPEPLHHFHHMFWDHDAKWCIAVVGAAELDFHFSLLQTTIGYHAFEDRISKLKQVTGRDHRAVQRYIVGVIAGTVPRPFLIAVRALIDFQYLVQAPSFTDDSLIKVVNALQEFHDHKDAIVCARAQKDSWGIPKLELLQSVVPSIRLSGAVMQWSADPTEHVHVQEIKVPARAGNNQNYYSQIARHLDRSEKCFQFNITTYIESQAKGASLEDDDEFSSRRMNMSRILKVTRLLST